MTAQHLNCLCIACTSGYVRGRLSVCHRCSFRFPLPQRLLPATIILMSASPQPLFRMELYVVALSWHRGVREVEEWLSHSSGVPLEELRPYLFLLRDRDATQHLLRVSGGLDSLVMGEGQILAQVRQVCSHSKSFWCGGIMQPCMCLQTPMIQTYQPRSKCTPSATCTRKLPVGALSTLDNRCVCYDQSQTGRTPAHTWLNVDETEPVHYFLNPWCVCCPRLCHRMHFETFHLAPFLDAHWHFQFSNQC